MMSLLKQAFENRTVLVTGHTGFKGAWLSLWLRELGAHVIGYALDPPSVPNLFEAIGLRQMLTHHHGDIRDHTHLLAIFKEYQPEVVFHLAAQPLVRFSYEEPRMTYETNVMGTVNVLEAIRCTESVRAAVIVTSDKCYENREWLWGYRECDPMGGRDPYSSSKGCAELVTSAYLQSFFSPERYGDGHRVALASARAGNVIGGGDWGHDRLIPDCVKALAKGEEVAIRNPRAIRPWQHVLEPLSGYLLLAAGLLSEGPRFAGPWNFGPADREIWRVGEVVQEVYRLWGKGCPRNMADAASQQNHHPHEAQWLKLDSSKALVELGWKPKYSVHDALVKTVEWYQQFYDGQGENALLDYTRQQIEAYSS